MATLATGLYFFLVNLITFIGMQFISVEQEIKIGDKLKDVMLNEAPVFDKKVDATETKLLQQFANKLQLSSKYPIRVTVVNSDIVNAYALPGGNVVVYNIAQYFKWINNFNSIW